MLMLNFLLKNVHHGLMVSMIALLITAFNHSFWVVSKPQKGGLILHALFRFCFVFRACG